MPIGTVPARSPKSIYDGDVRESSVARASSSELDELIDHAKVRPSMTVPSLSAPVAVNAPSLVNKYTEVFAPSKFSLVLAIGVSLIVIESSGKDTAPHYLTQTSYVTAELDISFDVIDSGICTTSTVIKKLIEPGAILPPRSGNINFVGSVLLSREIAVTSSCQSETSEMVIDHFKL